jgi:rSAM/selenodomain-associated transferase 2
VESWGEAVQAGGVILKRISVIMPVLNEGERIARALSTLPLTGDEELVVVDGGSTDRTVETARGFTENVFPSRAGRGRQMNAGAERAGGAIFLFLHADCVLPENAFAIIRATLKDKKISAGAFDLKVEHPSIWFRLIETGANIRSRLTSVPYGDQALFMRKETFNHIGGFRDIPVMEDIEIAGRMKSEGRVAFVRPPVLTSPRRWLKEGLVYTTLRDWSIALAYSLCNVPPERLVRYYRDVR